MPSGDGTGPLGFGPRSGRGRGGCRGFSSMGTGWGSRRMGIVGALIPVAAAAIRDLSNSNGLLRSLGRKLLPGKHAVYGEPVDASFSVIDDKKDPGRSAGVISKRTQQKKRITP